MAVTFYNIAADKVDDAAFKLSKIYKSGGEGIPQNPQVSLDFLKHAAKMGHPTPQFNLGLRFKNGEGAVKNPKKALKWLQKPDLQRYDEALYEVGLCYESGEGVPQDLSKALTYFNKSIKESEQGTHCVFR
jgi:TPR repeat protein